MKKILLLSVAVASLFIGAYLAKNHDPDIRNEIRKTDNVLKILPENTEFMLKLGSVETIYEHFSVTENSFFGKPVNDIEKIKNKLGFNPLVISELEANGVDTEKEIGFLVNGFKWKEENPALSSGASLKTRWEQADATNLFFIPVTDGQKVAEKLKILIKNEIPAVKFSQEGQLTVFEKENEDIRGYIFEKGPYLFIGISPKADAKAFMTSVISGKTSLSETKAYQDVVAKANDREEIFVYANIKKIAENNQAAIQNISKESDEEHTSYIRGNFKHLKDCESAGISVDLESKDFVAKSVFNMVPGSATLNIAKNIKFNKGVVLGVKENPALLLSFSINAPEYYRMILETLTQAGVKKFNDKLEKIRTDFGVDIEKDVVANLAGNFNLGIYDGMSINMFNYNALSTLAIKDEAKMKTVIVKVISAFSPEKQAMVSKTMLGDDEAYIFTMFGMMQLYAGVKDNNLIVSVGKTMFEKAVSGNAASGFVSAIKDRPLADILKGDTNLFYMNIGEISKAAKNFPFLTQHKNSEKIWEAIQQFEYVLSTGKIEGNSVYSNFQIKTKFSEPFFKEVQNISKELEMENENSNSNTHLPQPE